MAETFAALWNRAVRDHGAREFLVFRDLDGTVSSWTYDRFDDVVGRVAATLAERGVDADAPVHVMLRNCPAFIAIWLAAARLGAWFVPVDPGSTPRDVARQLRRIRPAVTICAEEFEETVAAGGAEQAIALAETAADLRDGSPLVGSDLWQEPASAAPDDRLAVMFTSGTTSEPKGVVLTQANYAHVGRTMADLAQLRPHHRWYVCLPLFHANAQYYCFASAIATGASVALTARFTASRWPHEVDELQATHASLFAAPIRMILARRRDDAPRLSLHHLWFAQNLALGHWSEMARLCGAAPRQIYGMTETVAVVTANDPDRPTHDRIGPEINGRAITLIDPNTGRPAADGEPGILTVAGVRGRDLFAGYLDNPTADARAFVDLDVPTPDADHVWFSTGDLVRRCDDGQLAFVGRIDDVVKVSGENVSLTEIEAALAEAPGVLEAAVLAIDDPIRDHVPAAWIVPADKDVPPSPEQLRQWAEQNLQPAARPRRWTVIDELPRTSVGKIRRFQLAAQERA
ncbi:class I adenylate-forming enzyme family protein [Gordonia sihwensis]|uniref:class I adenylate-forming enzyme family protein n=1 Tax=Gordonia sihwensis TaxID=173559 RepID=UPI0005EE5C6F|nr:class I adenylate-forming enzyme family protein [Gordonia sihwensis]KJR08194.1 O-succinylbenzoate--CoA ligase [Gordonia sihwensis]